MTDAELIARLRYAANGEHDMTPHGADILQAVDRIEELISERDQHWDSFVHWRKEADDRSEQLTAARQDAKEAEAYAEELEKDRDEAINQLDSARYSVDVLEKRVAFVENERKKTFQALLKTTKIHDEVEAKLAENEVRLRKAVELLEAWGDVAVHCSIEEGVCCCGDNMENHTNPMDCGHTPLDHGTYIAIQLAEETRATLAEIKGESHD